MNERILEKVKLLCRAYPYKIVGFGIVQHPLISSLHTLEDGKLTLITPETFDEHVNKRLALLEKSKDVSYMLNVFINKPYRITVLEFIQDELSVEEFGELLADCWTMIEWPHQHGINKLIKMFTRAQGHLMDNDDQAEFDALPEELTIYRGIQAGKATIRGLSWTTRLWTAHWFAKRFEQPTPIVYRANIAKKHCFLFTNGRKEYEVVVNPRYLKNITLMSQEELREEIDKEEQHDKTSNTD